MTDEWFCVDCGHIQSTGARCDRCFAPTEYLCAIPDFLRRTAKNRRETPRETDPTRQGDKT